MRIIQAHTHKKGSQLCYYRTAFCFYSSYGDYWSKQLYYWEILVIGSTAHIMVHKLYILREKLDIDVQKNKGWLFSHVCASANEIMLKISGFLLMAEKGSHMHGNYQHAEHQRKALNSPGRKELTSKFKKNKSTLIYKSFHVLTQSKTNFCREA